MAMSSKEKARRYRAKKRAQGLRLVQYWLPDVTSPEFAAEAHRQSLAIANSPHEKEDQAFLDELSWLNTPEGAASWTADWPE